MRSLTILILSLTLLSSESFAGASRGKSRGIVGRQVVKARANLTPNIGKTRFRSTLGQNTSAPKPAQPPGPKRVVKKLKRDKQTTRRDDAPQQNVAVEAEAAPQPSGVKRLVNAIVARVTRK